MSITVLLNAGIFQLGWFTCVLGAAHGLPSLSLVAASIAVIAQLHFAPKPGQELKLLLIAALIGGFWESVLAGLGLLAYPNGQWLPWLAPYWIVLMWVLFATTLNVSLRALRPRRWLAALCGAIAGPASFFSGMQLGGVAIPVPTVSLVSLAGGWAILMPVLCSLAVRYDGWGQVPSLQQQQEQASGQDSEGQEREA